MPAPDKQMSADAPRFSVDIVFREEIGAARHPREAFQFIADSIMESPLNREGFYEFTYEGLRHRVTVEPVVTGS